MVDLTALIDKQRADLGDPWRGVAEVVLGGELVEIEVRRLAGADWTDLVRRFPARDGAASDNRLGFNLDDLPAEYPVSHLSVSDEQVDAERWSTIYGLLDADSLRIVQAVIFQGNVIVPAQVRLALGKAKAGGSSVSPANRASRRAASKGGSRSK